MKYIGHLAAMLLISTAMTTRGYMNPIEGGTAQTVTNHWQVDLPWLFIGSNTDGNTLVVTPGGHVENQIGYIGGEAASSNNQVVVSGPGAMWVNTVELSVGRNGADNSLVITNGGQVVTPAGYIGNSSSGNLAEVSGEGSVLDSATLQVGRLAGDNELAVTAGGRVESTAGTIGYWIGADRNTVTVQGTRSMWRNAGNLVVGDYGSGNRLLIEDGALVESPTLNVGAQSISSNNLISVSGSGSLLDTSELNIGGTAVSAGGTGNLVEVQDGATVSTDDLTIYSGNQFDLNAGGRLAVSTHFNASMDGFNFNSGGTLEVGGELTGMSTSIEEQRTLILSGSNAAWNNSDTNLYVGEETSGNSMKVLGGAQVESSYGYVGYGYNSGSDSNAVVVSGSGSVWSNSSRLSVGYSGSGNTLEISDGGQIHSDFSSIGSRAGANNNAAIVTGGGSVWSDQGNFTVGGFGSGNMLTVADGGRVYNEDAWIGLGHGSDNNTVWITGNGSIWSINGILGVGIRGSGNMLRVDNGGEVFSDTGIIGWTEYDNNAVLVTGDGSTWSNSRGIRVGEDGSGNSLFISDGGSVVCSSVHVGYNPMSVGNQIDVVGIDSALSHTHELILGYYGSSNMLRVADGGKIESGRDGWIGNFATSSNNTALVSGEGSVWNISDNLYVGYFGAGNSLFITDGGRVENSEGILGVRRTGASGNSVTVSGQGSLWFNRGNLTVGQRGSDNLMMITDGGRVENQNGFIGSQASGAASNTVLVAGSGSVWNNGGGVYLGGHYQGASWIDGGQGNRLYVGEGGLISAGRDMHNRNHSLVSIDPGGLITAGGNYYQDATSVLRFGVETNAVGTPLNPMLSVGGTAEFEEGATLQYHSNVGVLEFDRFYTNLIVEADQLIVAGITNANALDLEAINLNGSLVDLLLWEQDQNIYGLVGRRYLAESAGFEPGSMMARLSREIDDLSLLGDAGAGRYINTLSSMSGARQNAQLTQRFTQGAPSYRHQQAVQGGQQQVLTEGRAFQAAARGPQSAPTGAAGPHKAGQKLRGWIRGYGSWADHDGTESFSGFEQKVYGTIIGLDKAYGKFLLGAAGGYARSDLNQDNGDSNDAETGYGVLYSSLGTTDWFGDLILSYGRSRIETRSGTAFGDTAGFDADNAAFYLGGGKEIKSTDGDNVILTPEAAMIAGYYAQEGYTDGLMKVDAYDRWSLQSRLGAAIAVERQVGSVVLKPEFRTYWLHEFNADPDRIGYSLIGGAGRYAFGMQAPDEDILEIGFGLSARFNDRLELVLDLDAQRSEIYRAYAVGGRVMYEF